MLIVATATDPGMVDNAPPVKSPLIPVPNLVSSLKSSVFLICTALVEHLGELAIILYFVPEV